MDNVKRAQVIMLPTENKKNSLWLDDANYLLSNHFLIKQKTKGKFVHLYIISDDEIKEGDWCMDIITKYIYRATRSIPERYTTQQKIIATTDSSLTIKINCNCGEGYQNPNCNEKGNGKICNELLPQPSEQFITKYIEEYNKSNIITDVLVEYRKPIYEDWIKTGESQPNLLLKVNPKDNTITIKKLKDSWNKEEVIELLKSVLFNANDLIITFSDGTTKDINFIGTFGFNKWIEKNL